MICCPFCRTPPHRHPKMSAYHVRCCECGALELSRASAADPRWLLRIPDGCGNEHVLHKVGPDVWFVIVRPDRGAAVRIVSNHRRNGHSLPVEVTSTEEVVARAMATIAAWEVLES